ncbi:MAG: hypothetical protein IJ349_05595 [Clostridia bacterium]|nr:hypothetical protein [Clostridia bacterium]
MKGKITRKSLRLPDFDYSLNGMYFITICTYGKRNIFGSINDEKMNLSIIGKIANEEIANANRKREAHFIEITKYVIMPNHIHMIIQIFNPDLFHDYQKEAFAAPTSKSISSTVRSFKAAVTKRTHDIYKTEETYKIWQPRYYDNIIRNEKAYQEIWNYIDSNVSRWEEDKFHMI